MKVLFSRTHNLFYFHPKRSISSSACCYAKSRKGRLRNRTLAQEGRGTDRIKEQIFMNKGNKFIPYDKNLEVTGKSVGPSREGGSRQAAELAAKHVVPETGYYNTYGRFIHVRNMKANFVVPDLTDCKLKPYVSYRTADIHQPKFTAAQLLRSQVEEDLLIDFKKLEMGVPFEEVLDQRMKILDEKEKLDKLDIKDITKD